MSPVQGIAFRKAVFSGVALATVLSACPAHAVIQFFASRAAWQSAVAGPTFAEDFSSFAADVPFDSAPVALVGMTISREGPEGGLTNFIDAPPLMFAGGSGTAQAEVFTNANEGAIIGTQVRITFAQLNRAFGFDSWAASDFEDAVLEVYDGGALLGSQALTGGAGDFLGYVVSGDSATSVRFRSATLIVGTTGEGFAIDNLAAAAVPEPCSWALWGAGGMMAWIRGRRRAAAAAGVKRLSSSH